MGKHSGIGGKVGFNWGEFTRNVSFYSHHIAIILILFALCCDYILLYSQFKTNI